MRLPRGEKLFAFSVVTKEPVNVIFEPFGADFNLAPDNELLVTVHGEPAPQEDGDLLIELTTEVTAESVPRVVLHLHQANYAVTDKAGNDLSHL